MLIDVPKSRPGVRNRFLEAPEEIQWYFEPAAELIDGYPWEVPLAYLFARLERAHIMTLYCGVVKLHRVDSELAAGAVDRFENRQQDFRALFENVLGRKFPRSLINKLKDAQTVRNRVLHGKSVEESGFRKAVIAIIEYAEEFNQTCFDLGGFRPVGRLQGFKGAGVSMDKATSRWVLKGIGLPID